MTGLIKERKAKIKRNIRERKRELRKMSQKKLIEIIIDLEREFTYRF